MDGVDGSDQHAVSFLGPAGVGRHPSAKNDGQRYELSEIGRALSTAIQPLDRWARRWAAQVSAGVNPERPVKTLGATSSLGPS